MSVLSDDKILPLFDQLAKEESIIYGPYETVKQDCNGYPLEFRICPALLKKPSIPGAKLDTSTIVSTPNGTHDLAINLFCVDRPQFMVLTRDSYRKQDEPLDREDFEAGLEMLSSRKDVYLIFNCGEEAGCSRTHKHMQGLRGPPYAFDLFVQGEDQLDPRIPFRYFTHCFVGGFAGRPVSDILAVYKDLVRRSGEVLGKSGGEEKVPHNVVVWRDWMIVMPRRAGALGNASANAAGMLGSVWVAERREVDEWVKLGCRRVLEECGVPA